jgi:hypothetical protein
MVATPSTWGNGRIPGATPEKENERYAKCGLGGVVGIARMRVMAELNELNPRPYSEPQRLHGVNGDCDEDRVEKAGNGHETEMGSGEARVRLHRIDQVRGWVQRAVVHRETAKAVGAGAGLRMFARESRDNGIWAI